MARLGASSAAAAIWIAVCACTAIAAAADPPPPRILPAFTSSLTLRTSPDYPQEGRVWYNATARSTKYFVSSPYPAAPQYPLNLTVLRVDDGEWQIANEQCREVGGGFVDWFAWVAASSYAGNVTFDGRACWEFTLQSGGSLFRMDVLAADPSVPVRYWITSGSALVVSYEFGADLVPSVSASAFDLSKLCTINDGHGFVCRDGEPRTIMPMLRYHAADDYSLANKNTADTLGDVAYLCLTVWSKPSSQLLSLFSVEVDSRWGQYALCNGGVCVGGTPGTVGHASMGNLHAFSGQCSANADTGNWYSMDAANECTGSQEVGRGCAWKVLERVKSVSTTCLNDHGLRAACLVDRSVPYAQAVALVEKALASDMCPDVPPATELGVRDAAVH